MASRTSRQRHLHESRTRAGGARKGLRRAGARLRLEALEGRLLLSVSPTDDSALLGDVGIQGDPLPCPAPLFASSSLGNAALPGDATSSAAIGFERFASAGELEQFLVKDALTRYCDLFGKPAYPWDYALVGIPPNGEASTDTVPPQRDSLDHSQTNTQVAGVDEGDIVETDGNFLYVLSDSGLVILDAWPGSELHVESRVAIEGQPLAEYLQGDRVTVLSTASVYGWKPYFRMVATSNSWWHISSKLNVTVLDVSDRASPRLVQRTEIDGNFVDSRAIGNHVDLVMGNNYLLPHPQAMPAPDVRPTGPSDPFATTTITDGGNLSPWPRDQGNFVYETQDQYLARIAGHVLDLALPHYTSFGADGAMLASGLMSQATDIYRPRSTDDTMLTSVVIFDASSEEPGPVSSTSVPGGPHFAEVYASEQSIYWLRQTWGTSPDTTILKLDQDATGASVRLSAAGTVPGQIINQFAVDEYQGFLRIATTQGWGTGATSGVYVLHQDGELLEIVGRADGLAPGEQIFSARFLGDMGFLVTFLRKDPLFTLDLSDPSQPHVVGQLDIPGFSNYLQALDGGYLIGIGRNADPATGRFQEPQVSLFDVADPVNPTLLDRFTIDAGPWGWSDAFSDHHAVAYYPEYQVLTISVTADGRWVHDVDRTGQYLPPEADLWVFKIDVPPVGQGNLRQGEIQLLGRVAHDAPVRRSVRVEDLLYSVSADTVSVHPILDPQAEIARVYFGTRMQDLGAIDWRQLDGRDFQTTDPWYSFEAMRDGRLAVELAALAGSNRVNFTLYDENLRLLANSSPANGNQRIDWQSTAHDKFYLRVSRFAGVTATDEPFALRLGNLVEENGGVLTVHGTAGDDRLDLDSFAAVVNGMRYPFDRAAIKSITLDGGDGNDVYRLAMRGCQVEIVDSAGVDTLDFSRAAGPLKLHLEHSDGQVQWCDAGRNLLEIHGMIEKGIGTAFGDVIVGNSADNFLDGRGGDDRIYAGGGNDILVGGLGNDRLYGDAGNDILLGGDGYDVLTAGAGGTLLVGGRGKDVLVGSTGDDILIAGATNYDANYAALAAILSEWTSARSFAQRIDSLASGGGLNGSFVLKSNRTLHTDGARDILFGGLGSDWFLYYSTDLVADRTSIDR